MAVYSRRKKKMNVHIIATKMSLFALSRLSLHNFRVALSRSNAAESNPKDLMKDLQEELRLKVRNIARQQALMGDKLEAINEIQDQIIETTLNFYNANCPKSTRKHRTTVTFEAVLQGILGDQLKTSPSHYRKALKDCDAIYKVIQKKN
eukprot:CAMPEP_0114985890 /NCGR_PEP_ID=MMETSP0216-20121206/8128_1 /TAXON_ID=223996 /ORGANISM="Protocruzia adherens, Strain Boccale" /LENGTH=148 /DNA_ID=CAMNT_0002348277 /DNA_START=260 /DNA_END=703 /DNA_ORIENTATION=+